MSEPVTKTPPNFLDVMERYGAEALFDIVCEIKRSTEATIDDKTLLRSCNNILKTMIKKMNKYNKKIEEQESNGR
jgi:hypothetical protein